MGVGLGESLEVAVFYALCGALCFLSCRIYLLALSFAILLLHVMLAPCFKHK